MSKWFKLCGQRFEVLLPHHPKEKYKTHPLWKLPTVGMCISIYMEKSILHKKWIKCVIHILDNIKF